MLIGIFLLVGRVDVRFWVHRSPDYSSAPILREKFDADSLRGEVRRRGVVPWKLAGTGRDRSRDMLENWWLSHPNAPAGLSCAKLSSHTEPGGAENDVFSALGQVGSNFTFLSAHEKPGGLETAAGASVDDTYFYRGRGIAPPVFRARTPQRAEGERIQVALVIPFVDSQFNRVVSLLTERWSAHPPCLADSAPQSADLIIFTENRLSEVYRRRIRDYYTELGAQKVGCFHTNEPIFLSLSQVEFRRYHLEGAAYTFFSLFPLLERSYKTFLLCEPDCAPVQAGFVPALVRKSSTVNCGEEGSWQLGSPPLAKDVDAGMLQERVDFHMNGNAIYVLGCPDFEDYMCRAQTFYVPRDDCMNVAGCSTHEAYEEGYDHVLYRFRMHPDNYEYSRLVLHKFAYSKFIQNLGEAIYDPVTIVEQSPTTYFVHSKTIFQREAATIIKEVSMSVIKRNPCHRDSATEKVLEKIYRYLRNGEYSKADAIRHLCTDAKYKRFGSRQSSRICDLYAVANGGSSDPPAWKFRMPGKAYLWTMDFHGGPANCDMSVIASAGGVLHAEIDGICEFYGLCKDRLKVIQADRWKEFDPTEAQIQEFTATYETDPEFERVDAFICHHPAANCELFLPFKKSIIVHATTRLEFGRHDEGIDWRISSGYDRSVGAKKWKQWVRTLQNLAKDSHNIIAANNLYDRDYIKYFTGIQDVLLLPSWCGDNCVGASFCKDGWESKITEGWLPTRPEVMIVPYRSNLDRSRYRTGIRDPKDHPIIKELAAVPEFVSNGTVVKMIRELYSDANPLRMLKHPAIVVLPYQISTIQLVELYRLNIPTFCPSLSLLKRWCREHDLLWEVHYGWPENLMNVTDIPNPNGHPLMDKYGKEWEDMFDHWIPKSDFYRFGHITYFDSWEHFHRLYRTMQEKGELDTTSHKMAASNAKLRKSLVEKWRHVLQRVRRDPVDVVVNILDV
eukprot:SAG25_NODE_846_length_5084_cov_13.320963_1_plen_956_part_00